MVLFDELGDFFHFFSIENRFANGGLNALNFDVGDLGGLNVSIGGTVIFVYVFVVVVNVEFICVFAVVIFFSRTGDFVGNVVDVGFDVVVSA